MPSAFKLKKAEARCRQTPLHRGLSVSVKLVCFHQRQTKPKKASDAIEFATRRYEAHPYPRWDNIYDCIRSTQVCAVPPLLPRAAAAAAAVATGDSVAVAGPERVLVAGCGTGRFALQLAASRPSAQFVLLDQVVSLFEKSVVPFACMCIAGWAGVAVNVCGAGGWRMVPVCHSRDRALLRVLVGSLTSVRQAKSDRIARSARYVRENFIRAR